MTDRNGVLILTDAVMRRIHALTSKGYFLSEAVEQIKRGCDTRQCPPPLKTTTSPVQGASRCDSHDCIMRQRPSQ